MARCRRRDMQKPDEALPGDHTARADPDGPLLAPGDHECGAPASGDARGGRQVRSLPGRRIRELFGLLPAAAAEEGGHVPRRLRRGGGRRDVEHGGIPAGVSHLRRVAGKGGAQLNVPRGRWVTGSFNLTSNFTLFLEEGAVILGSQDPKEWPVIDALPSYGRGKERPGGRHISLVHADGVSNVVITGQNGSIDGQGKMWWELWWNRTLQHTRGHLLELVNSHNILISNITFLNSPFWTIHPIYCSNVVIKDVSVGVPSLPKY